jgi:SAM-dependent methyltransferase
VTPPGDGRPRYAGIIDAYEAYLARHGDCYLGVGWTRSQEHADLRYRVMLEAIRERGESVSLLDFGCGLSHLYEYMRRTGVEGVRYHGLDLSPRMLEASRRKFPDLPYFEIDVLEDAAALPCFDYAVMNGVFTLKVDLSQEEMVEYLHAVVAAVFSRVRRGLAFNVMSVEVEWEREDLFHLPFDQLARFLASEISRHFVMRHDYGLYEYTTYVYRHP